MDKKKTVITYGTFDLLHEGHRNLLKRAKSLGDYLIVAVSTDEFNAIKGKKAHDTFEERVENLLNDSECKKYIDKIIPENFWEQKIIDIKKYGVDVFTIGDDWKGKFDELMDLCEVVYLPRTPGISSTQLREQLKENKVR